MTGLERRQETTRNSLERCIDWPQRYDKMRDVRADNVTFKLTPLPQQATRFECHITIASVTVDQCCRQNSLPNSCLFIKIAAAIDETFQHRRSYLIFPRSSFFLSHSFYFLSYYFSSAFFPRFSFPGGVSSANTSARWNRKPRPVKINERGRAKRIEERINCTGSGNRSRWKINRYWRGCVCFVTRGCRRTLFGSVLTRSIVWR